MPSSVTTDNYSSLVDRRRTEIVDAAEYLIALHGYDALKLRDVAQQAGVSIGTIQHYFVTRNDLLRNTVRVASERRAGQWSQLGGDKSEPREQLMALLEGAVSNRHRCIVWIETCAAATRHPELQEDVEMTQSAWRVRLREVIEAGSSAGDFSPYISTEEAVSLLVNLIDGMMLSVAIQDYQNTSIEGAGSSATESPEEVTRGLRRVAQAILKFN